MIFSINLENSIFLTTTTTTQQNPIIFYKKSKTGVNYIWILYLTEKSMSTGIFKLQMNFNECILLQSDKWQYRLPTAYPPPPPHIFNFYVSSYFCSENESVLHIHVFFLVIVCRLTSRMFLNRHLQLILLFLEFRK